MNNKNIRDIVTKYLGLALSKLIKLKYFIFIFYYKYI